MASLLLTTEQAADELALSRTVIYELLARGELEGVRIGRARRITRESVEAFVARLSDTNAGAA